MNSLFPRAVRSLTRLCVLGCFVFAQAWAVSGRQPPFYEVCHFDGGVLSVLSAPPHSRPGPMRGRAPEGESLGMIVSQSRGLDVVSHDVFIDEEPQPLWSREPNEFVRKIEDARTLRIIKRDVEILGLTSDQVALIGSFDVISLYVENSGYGQPVAFLHVLRKTPAGERIGATVKLFRENPYSREVLPCKSNARSPNNFLPPVLLRNL